MFNENFSSSEKKYLVDVALEEYKALRAEILAQFQNRNNVLTFGGASLGLFVAFAAQTDPKANTVSSYFVGAILIPILSSFFILLWGIHSAKIAKIGCYLAGREEKINQWLSSTNEPALNWEKSLRHRTLDNDEINLSIDNDEINLSIGIIFVFTVISLVCAGFSYNFCKKPDGFQYYLFQSISGIVISGGILLGCWLIRKIYHSFHRCEYRSRGTKRGRRRQSGLTQTNG